MIKSNQLPLKLSLSSRDNLRFDLPIAQRLTLGFLIAALIAGIVAGGIGIQRVQSLHQQSDFYQNLLQAKSNLTHAEVLLELMSNKTHELLNLTDPVQSRETWRDDKEGIKGLISQYNKSIDDYEQSNMLDQHPEQMQLLNGSGHVLQISQQRVLLNSLHRTWTQYGQAQQKILDLLGDPDLAFTDPTSASLHLKSAYNLNRTQGEPMNADTQSAMRALIQFSESLALSVQDILHAEESYQLMITSIGVVLAFIGIALVGLFVSNALVYRLKLLRHATRAVEEGQMVDRVRVIGRDEIADISTSINAMLEFIAAEQEIMTASELKDQFIASVSHELRNPLTEVYGWLEILHDYKEQLDPQTQEKFLNKAIYGCQELMLLINNVLDATQGGKQKKPLHLEKIAVAPTVQHILDHLDPRGTATYHLRMDIPDGLTVWADAQYMRQILRNLLSNALKYTPEESTIVVTAVAVGAIDAQTKQVCISIQDNGPGILPAEIPHLFHKFARLQHANSEKVRGTGLGLYICKQLVESMEGSIWVESSGIPGEGSRFSFTLHDAQSAVQSPIIKDLSPAAYSYV